MPIKVLCLDIEGGFGGSSRSLFETIKHIDRNAVSPVVWCRKDGPIVPRYGALGIECRVMPEMPRATSVPRLSRNLAVFGYFLRDWMKAGEFRREILEASEKVDLIHFNHEALFFLARWLRKRSSIPTSMHIRTVLRDSIFARWQERMIIGAVDHQVCITENEKASLESIAGRPSNGTVIYNIVSPPNSSVEANNPCDETPFTIASLSNFDWVRGTDRLIGIAECLAAMNRRDIRFVMGGHIAVSRNLPGELGEIGRRGGTLANFAAARGVSDMFDFRGHVPDPENILAKSHVLAKPTREANPWGRDIIEGLAAGRPVITCGRYDRFVEDRVTGILLPKFDAETFAQRIVELADNRALLKSMSEAAKRRVADLCDGPARSNDLLSVWRSLMATKD